MKNLILAIAAIAFASPAIAGTPTGVLNPDGSITYTLSPNDDVPQYPGALAAVEVGCTGNGFYSWQVLTGSPGLTVSDEYLITWDVTWGVELSTAGQYLWDVGGEFNGHHGGTAYSGNPEPVLTFTPPAGSRFVERRLRNVFVGRGTVDLDWNFAVPGSSSSVTAWSESTGYIGTGSAVSSLGLEFQVTYYPATL